MNSYTVRDSITDDQLEKWFSKGRNILIFGNHGVGKTALIKNFCEKKKLKLAMFSGSSLDPWVDFIGIPKLVKVKGKSVIEFALPQTIDDEVEIIFIDEYNRSAAAVRNAVLELIQFKSINGRKFPNLKVVWAAANPPDTENNYDVEEIDPAQEDRFHVILKLSGKPDSKYFSDKYGEEVSQGAMKWYENLSPELKNSISPRRLDYALDWVVNCDGEARDILADERINISTFTRAIRGNKQLRELLNLQQTKDGPRLKEFFKSQKNVQPCLKHIIENFELSNLFIEYGDTEEVIAFANSDESFSVLTYQATLRNENLKTALDSYRTIHSKNPAWFEGAHKIVRSSRAALDYFLEYRDLFIDSRTELRVGDLVSSLNFKSPEEIVDDIKCMDSAALYTLDEDSARNTLNFFSRIDLKDFVDKNADSAWVKKAYSLIYSAFNHFYLRDANLQGASFACKGCEKIAHAPPFAGRNAGGSGSRGRNGRLSISEDVL